MSLKMYMFFIALCLTVGAGFIFLWAFRTGQFDDIEEVKYTMLKDEIETSEGEKT